MLSHVDKSNQPTMVDVKDKQVTKRLARAQCYVKLPSEVLKILSEDEIHGPKGPVFQTAIIAGTMAAKRTSELIPFCHPIGLESCKVQIRVIEDKAVIESTVQVEAKTGVEMEALVACQVAALTVYDMCKALSHDLEISGCHLLEKKGGKSDYSKKT